MRFIASNRPTWHESGVADAIKTVELRYPGNNLQVAIHCLTQAAKASNEKPITMTFDLPDVSHEPVRATETVYCQTHPKAGVRTDGTCAGCWADRQTPDPRPVFVPRPLPANLDELRRLAGVGTSRREEPDPIDAGVPGGPQEETTDA